MTVFEATILGVLQGLTEFLPISSSGHLVIGQALLDIKIPGNMFEVVVHIGTLMSVLVVFKPEWVHLLKTLNQKPSNTYVFALFLGTIPAVLIGYFFKDIIEKKFDDVTFVAYALLFTGIILLTTKWLVAKNKPVGAMNGLLIGCAQAMAIIPGISRSGATISTGLALGLSTKDSARFSFLLAIPAITGAGILTGIDLITIGGSSLSWQSGLAALFSSFVVGVVSLKWLLSLIVAGIFYRFSVYCFFIGGMTLWLV